MRNPALTADLSLGLLDFTRHFFPAARGGEYRRNYHQDRVAAALERVVIGRCRRLIINIPPRSGKTELAVINFIAWAMGMFPDSEFIHTSYSKRLAAGNTYRVRALMQSREYRMLFPWTQLSEDASARDEFRTTKGGIVYASGSTGTITGYGAGKMRKGFGGALVIDDPHKAGEGRSDARREAVIEVFQNTLENRLNNPSETPIILIMQRLHEQDLAGFLSSGANGDDWEVISIPAIRSDGQSFWPDQFPIETLRRMERANPYEFAGQFMQRPAPIGGGMFPIEKFGIREDAPAVEDIAASVRYWDKAGTADGGAYTAGVLVHRMKDGRFVVADVQRGQWGALDREKRIKHCAKTDGNRVHIWVEQEPGSGGKESAEATILGLSGFVARADRVTGDKVARAEPYASQVQAGHVTLVRAPWNRPFLSEHEVFPNGQFKDQVDAAAGAFARLIVRRKIAGALF